VISAPPPRKWRHPWWTTPAWSPEAQQWVATVEPGFVNGNAPVLRATVAEQQAAGNPWEINPLTGKQFFSDPIFGNQPGAISTKTVDLPLYLSPAIPLTWRPIGFDGDPNAGVPQYFLNLGAAKAPPQQDQLAALISGNEAPPAAPPPPNLRLLRACDLWIHQPRLGLTSTVTILGDLALGTGNVVQQLSPVARS